MEWSFHWCVGRKLSSYLKTGWESFSIRNVNEKNGQIRNEREWGWNGFA